MALIFGIVVAVAVVEPQLVPDLFIPGATVLVTQVAAFYSRNALDQIAGLRVWKDTENEPKSNSTDPTSGQNDALNEPRELESNKPKQDYAVIAQLLTKDGHATANIAYTQHSKDGACKHDASMDLTSESFYEYLVTVQNMLANVRGGVVAIALACAQALYVYAVVQWKYRPLGNLNITESARNWLLFFALFVIVVGAVALVYFVAKPSEDIDKYRDRGVFPPLNAFLTWARVTFLFLYLVLQLTPAFLEVRGFVKAPPAPAGNPNDPGFVKQLIDGYLDKELAK